MINRLQATNPGVEIALLTTNPVLDEHAAVRPRLLEYYQMYRDVARQRELLLIDSTPAWQSLLTESRERFLELVPDGIHP